MRKKLLMIFLVLSVLFNTAGVFAKSENSYIDSSYVNSGVVYVNYPNDNNTKTKLMIEKDGSKYTYNLNSNNASEGFSLQMGSGEYKISILENVEGNKYKYIFTEKVKAEIENDDLVYLNSIQNVNWKDAPEAVKKAKSLVKGNQSTKDKVKAVYDFLVNNFSYDYEKLDKLSFDYLPDADQMLEDGEGICYDFASLFAVMLRSQGIPVKMVKGYTTNVEGYHAWNEVYDSDTNSWQVIDTTYDAAANKAKAKLKMYKNVDEYEKVFEY